MIKTKCVVSQLISLQLGISFLVSVPLVASNSTDCDMTGYMSSGSPNPDHSLTHSLACTKSRHVCYWPSTALVEKKAKFLVSSGFSLVNSADLLWGSDSPVSDELSTWNHNKQHTDTVYWHESQVVKSKLAYTSVTNRPATVGPIWCFLWPAPIARKH